METFDLTYDSVIIMVRPVAHPGIMVHHDLHVVVADRDVTEDRNRSYRALSDSDSIKEKNGLSSQSYVSWDVTQPNKFVRIEFDPQSVRTMIVNIDADSTCHLDVSDALDPGYSEYKFSRIAARGSGASPAYGYFSTYRVVQTSCLVK